MISFMSSEGSITLTRLNEIFSNFHHTIKRNLIDFKCIITWRRLMTNYLSTFKVCWLSITLLTLSQSQWVQISTPKQQKIQEKLEQIEIQDNIWAWVLSSNLNHHDEIENISISGTFSSSVLLHIVSSWKEFKLGTRSFARELSKIIAV